MNSALKSLWREAKGHGFFSHLRYCSGMSVMTMESYENTQSQELCFECHSLPQQQIFKELKQT